MNTKTESQEQRILSYLEKGGRLTGAQAFGYFGCWRLAARIESLRRKGFVIITRMIKTKTGKRVAEYRRPQA